MRPSCLGIHSVSFWNTRWPGKEARLLRRKDVGREVGICFGKHSYRFSYWQVKSPVNAQGGSAVTTAPRGKLLNKARA